jgi:Trk-type K+ transport system membrane component
MALFIAIWAGIGFSVIATGVADRKMEEKARLRGVALNPNARFKRLFLIALASTIVFAVVTYNVLKSL